MKTRKALPAASGVFAAKSLTLSTARSVTLRMNTDGDVACVAAVSVTLDMDTLRGETPLVENESWGPERSKSNGIAYTGHPGRGGLHPHYLVVKGCKNTIGSVFSLEKGRGGNYLVRQPHTPDARPRGERGRKRQKARLLAEGVISSSRGRKMGKGRFSHP